MIYLLGGAPRTGKSLLARRINRQRGISIVSTDLLRGVLMMTDSDLRDAMLGDDPVLESERFYVHLRQAVACLLLQEPDALIEGVGFLPCHVTRLQRELGIQVRSCFLGHSAATSEALFGHETANRFYDNLNLEQQRVFARRVIDWTSLVATECQRHNLPFVDLANASYEESLRVAEMWLFDAKGTVT